MKNWASRLVVVAILAAAVTVAVMKIARMPSQMAAVYFMVGETLVEQGESEQAINFYSRGLRLNSHSASAYSARGYLYQTREEWEKARADYDQALRLDPKNAATYARRAEVWMHQREWRKAAVDLAETVRLQPTNSWSLNARAWLLATSPEASVRNGAEAVTLATKACELTAWRNWQIVDTLAAAYAETGNFDKAVKYQEQALGINGVDDSQRPEMEQRLDLYRRKEPYRENRDFPPVQ